jgi:ABC-type sugar transport system permease subunit
MDNFNFLFSYDLRFIFYVVIIFSVMLTTFFLVVKSFNYYNDHKFNSYLQKDFEKGISFKKFIRELNTFESKSSFAKIILSGNDNFKDAYKIGKYNYGSPILLAKTSMKESMHSELLLRKKYLNIFAFNSIVTAYIGIIYFLIEIVEKFNTNQLFFESIINNIYILIIALLLSMYSSLLYFIFVNINSKYEERTKCYIESFLKFLHKEIIINNE